MRARLIALGLLAVLLAVATIALAHLAAQAQVAGQLIGSSGQLTDVQSAREQQLFVLSYALQTMIPAIATAALFSVIAIVAVLARSTQLRRLGLAR